MTLLPLLTVVCLMISISLQGEVTPTSLSASVDGAMFRYTIKYTSPAQALVLFVDVSGRLYDEESVTRGEKFDEENGEGEAYILVPWQRNSMLVLISPKNDSSEIMAYSLSQIQLEEIPIDNIDLNVDGGKDLYYSTGDSQNITFRYPNLGTQQSQPQFLWIFLGINSSNEETPLVYQSAFHGHSPGLIGPAATILEGDEYVTSVPVNLTTESGLLFASMRDFSTERTFYTTTSLLVNIMPEGNKGPFPTGFMKIFIFGDFFGDERVRCYHGDHCDLVGGALGSGVTTVQVVKVDGQSRVKSGFSLAGEWYFLSVNFIADFSIEDEGEYIWTATNSNNRTVERRVVVEGPLSHPVST